MERKQAAAVEVAVEAVVVGGILVHQPKAQQYGLHQDQHVCLYI